MIRYSGQETNKRDFFEKSIPFHKCTEEEYAEFYPIREDKKTEFDFKKTSIGFYCIDWDNNESPHLIYGYPSSRAK